MNDTVARTILDQLGGRKFLTMTGAKDLLAGEDYLQFTLPVQTKNKANKCRVTLTWRDTYDLTFYRFNRKTLDCPIVDTAEDIYNDQLQVIFTAHTGLATRLF